MTGEDAAGDEDPAAKMTRLYVQDRLTLDEVAATVGLAPSTVRRRLLAKGVQLRAPGERGRVGSLPSERQAAEQLAEAVAWFDEGVEVAEIARRQGLSYRAVRWRLVEKAGRQLPARRGRPRALADGGDAERLQQWETGEMVRLWREGLTPARIATQLASTARTVRLRLAGEGIDADTPPAPGGPEPDDRPAATEVDLQVQARYAAGTPLRVFAAEWGCSHAKARRRLEGHGVQLRTGGQRAPATRTGRGVIRWEDPPPDAREEARKVADHFMIAKDLRSMPGRWGLIAMNLSGGANGVMDGTLVAYRPVGTFEAVCRFVDEATLIYARFVGEQGQFAARGPVPRTLQGKGRRA